MMEVGSLGYKTDLIFSVCDDEFKDRGDYLVVKTPTNPTFYGAIIYSLAVCQRMRTFKSGRR